jgi:hypothetical protein
MILRGKQKANSPEAKAPEASSPEACVTEAQKCKIDRKIPRHVTTLIVEQSDEEKRKRRKESVAENQSNYFTSLDKDEFNYVRRCRHLEKNRAKCGKPSTAEQQRIFQDKQGQKLLANPKRAEAGSPVPARVVGTTHVCEKEPSPSALSPKVCFA